MVLKKVFLSSFQWGTAVVDVLKCGFLSKMLATLVSGPAILLGRIFSDVFRVIAQSSIILGLAFVLGASADTGIPGYLLMLVIIAFFGIAWSGISLALGLKTKNSETVFGIAAFLTFPLLFMSTALVPPSFLPGWMAQVSQFNPISITVDGLRTIMLPGFDIGNLRNKRGCRSPLSFPRFFPRRIGRIRPPKIRNMAPTSSAYPNEAQSRNERSEGFDCRTKKRYGSRATQNSRSRFRNMAPPVS